MANVPPPAAPPPPPAGPPPPGWPRQPGPSASAPIPRSVKAIRVMLWILVGAAGVMLIAGLLLAQDARQAGEVTAGPIIIGVPALILALKATKRSKGVWIGLIVFESLMILMSLSQLSSGSGRSLITLAIHITVLVLVLRRTARDYYRGSDQPPGPYGPAGPFDSPGQSAQPGQPGQPGQMPGQPAGGPHPPHGTPPGRYGPPQQPPQAF